MKFWIISYLWERPRSGSPHYEIVVYTGTSIVDFIGSVKDNSLCNFAILNVTEITEDEYNRHKDDWA